MAKRLAGLYYWRPRYAPRNFGDSLAPHIIRKLAGRKVPRVADADTGGKLLSIGSILHCARDGDVIWGTGLNGKVKDPQEYQFQELDVRAVRGPITRDFLLRLGVNCPAVYGDPAALLGILLPDLKPEPENDYLLVPHLSEIPLFRGEPHQILPSDGIGVIIKAIARARFVISSGLHALIVAEALGVPARMLRVSATEPWLKFEDYYLGTGRSSFRAAYSVTEALDLGGEKPPDFDRQALIQAFPLDVLYDEALLSETTDTGAG